MSPVNQTPQGLEHICPACHAVYVDDCLAEIGEYHLLVAKSRVVTAAGIGCVVILLALIAVAYQGYVKGFTTGIDLGHVTMALLVAFGLIMAWAFPKRNGK